MNGVHAWDMSYTMLYYVIHCYVNYVSVKDCKIVSLTSIDCGLFMFVSILPCALTVLDPLKDKEASQLLVTRREALEGTAELHTLRYQMGPAKCC